MNLFCFFLPTREKEEGNSTHIAHIDKAPRANAQTKACQRVQSSHPPVTTMVRFHISCYLLKKVKNLIYKKKHLSLYRKTILVQLLYEH
jgi:hypothetical protein